ncbi:hypothetical protein LSM04_005254 [Trypanosoma melophagium]|uniref:uncharacterized protein n=1 Tax=Trypanosoma melophagium TaxID=715481 RepID=UPI00351A9382|nr:hypothetical protein LSM04_005254 [Trypanosoma melophagium]
MNSMGGNWRIALEDNIRFSEQILQRLRDRQSKHETARQLLVTAFNASSEQQQQQQKQEYQYQPQQRPPTSLTLGELSDNVNCLQLQVKNCLAELNTERTVRCDGVREVQQLLSNEVGELRAMCMQLKKENTYLGETVRSLEKRLLLTSVNPSTDIHHRQATTLHTVPSTASTSSSSDLVRRVEELESTVLRQRRLMEDRQTRLDGVLREMANVKINTEMERVRSVARDAARSCAEDVVRLRLADVQSTVSAELQKMMEFVTNNNKNSNNKNSNNKNSDNDGDSLLLREEQLREVKEDDLQQVSDANAAVEVLSNSTQRHENYIHAVEDRLLQRITKLEEEFTSSQTKLREAITKCTREMSEDHSTTEQLRLESILTDRLQSLCHNIMLGKADGMQMRDALQQQITTLRDQFTEWRETNNNNNNKERQYITDMQERLENTQHAWESSQLELQQQLTRVEQQVRSLRNDVDQWKPRVRNAITVSEEARASVQEFVISIQSIEANTREGIARHQAQLQTFRSEQESTAAMLRQLTIRMTAMEEVRQTVEDVCMPKLMALGRVSLELQQQREKEIEKEKEKHKEVEIQEQQLSVLRREVQTGLKSVEDRLLTILRNGQQESTIAIETLKSCLDDISTNVKSHETLFAHTSTVNSVLMEITGITEKLQWVESTLDELAQHPLPVSQEEENKEKDPSIEIEKLRHYTETALEALRHRVAEVEHLSTHPTNHIQQQQQQQQQLEHRAEEEIERVTQLFHRLREECTTQLQKVRVMMEEEVERRYKHIENAYQSSLQRLQQQLERLQEMTSITRVVGAITEDAGLLQSIVQSLQDVFIRREEHTASVTQLLRKIQQQEEQLTEIDGRCQLHEHDWTHRLRVLESSQRDQATRAVELEQQLRQRIEECKNGCSLIEGKFTSLELQQQTTADLNKRWREESRKDYKKDAELLTEHLEERVSAVQSVAATVELQTRTLQLSVKELQQQYTAIKEELDKITLSIREGIDHPEKNVTNNNTSTSTGNSNSEQKGDNKDDDSYNKWSEELYSRITALEERVELAAQTTADTLSGLQESIQTCVMLFVQHVSSSALLQQTPADTPEWRAVADVRGLDGVLLFLWDRLCGLYETAQTLQNGALGTLDVLQQHEERLVLLQPVKSLVVCTANHMAEMAEAIGMPHDVYIDPRLLDTTTSNEGDGNGDEATE